MCAGDSIDEMSIVLQISWETMFIECLTFLSQLRFLFFKRKVLVFKISPHYLSVNIWSILLQGKENNSSAVTGISQMCLHFLPQGLFPDKDYTERDITGVMINIMRNNTCKSMCQTQKRTSSLSSLSHVKYVGLDAHYTPDIPLLCEHGPRIWKLRTVGGNGY